MATWKVMGIKGVTVCANQTARLGSNRELLKAAIRHHQAFRLGIAQHGLPALDQQWSRTDILDKRNYCLWWPGEIPPAGSDPVV